MARDLSEEFALKPTQAAARAELERDRAAAAARQVSVAHATEQHVALVLVLPPSC